jgi:chemotaxis protein methyltransferase CheR
MSPEDFEYTARLIKERSGLVLTRDKGYLLENRMMPVVRDHKFKSFAELVARLKDGDTTLQTAAIDAMMAKDTAFFRDWKPFTHFRNVVLPNLCVARGAKKTFRILCAGASTGQEAYSLAISIRDAKPFDGWATEVVGIDISASALATAARATYSQFDVQRGLPIRTLLQYFAKHDDAWALDDSLRAMVKFQTWNLLDDLFPLGRFDVVLCRNVLVYFDLQTKLDVLHKLSRLLVDDGVLYLGLNETVMGVSGSFRPVDADAGIYAAHRADRATVFSLATKV